HLIMDRLCRYHSLDIQWGNHDIIWMGAAAGNPACIATVVRNSIRYGNLDVVEEGYGINMLPLATFALKAYKDDPCTRFVFKVAPSGADNMESDLIKKMHKAIAIIRFKLEGQLIKKWPEYGMKERLLLEHIDYEQGTIDLEGRTYKLLDTSFPTIDPADPYRLTEGEEEVIQRLRSSFIHCEKLKN
ncbi:MAG TPA: class 3 fructose-bisphosphatase, partial [Eubacterium sp.]|nr:class 3 fructose-bisphosphatase [Eubacterium sp.]